MRSIHYDDYYVVQLFDTRTSRVFKILLSHQLAIQSNVFKSHMNRQRFAPLLHTSVFTAFPCSYTIDGFSYRCRQPAFSTVVVGRGRRRTMPA